jgi:hypothetical protein
MGSTISCHQLRPNHQLLQHRSYNLQITTVTKRNVPRQDEELGWVMIRAGMGHRAHPLKWFILFTYAELYYY